MIRLSSKITIGKYVFNGATEVEIDSSWDELTDTAKITLPRRLSWQGQDIILGKDPVLKKGDKVTIELGYDDDNDLAFVGYVTSVMATIPAEIHCEDAMWLLKQKTITKSYKSVGLKKLLQDLLLKSDTPFEASAVELGPFRITRASVAKVLEKLRSTYMLKSFFRDGKLYCGFAYWPKLQKRHKLRFDLNVIENDLTYVRAEDVKIKLTIVVISKGNEKKEFQFGDEDGEQRTLHYYDITDKQAKAIGEEEIVRLRYDGYRGGLTTFGKPFINHGDVVDLVDPFFPDRDGSYLVKKVARSSGFGGYRQTIELDSKI